MKVLSTRRTPEGFKKRRYEHEGIRFNTVEIPIEILNEFGAKKLAEMAARAKRNMERKLRNARAKTLLANGWKTTAVANEVGLCDSQVRRLRQRMMK